MGHNQTHPVSLSEWEQLYLVQDFYLTIFDSNTSFDLQSLQYILDLFPIFVLYWLDAV